MIESTPRFLQGMFAYTGAGFDAPVAVQAITVSTTRRAQPVYLRAGNSADAMACLVLSRDGVVMRLFPVGAKSAIHVPLAVVEDIEPGTTLSLAVAAESGVAGTMAVDFGLVEV